MPFTTSWPPTQPQNYAKNHSKDPMFSVEHGHWKVNISSKIGDKKKLLGLISGANCEDQDNAPTEGFRREAGCRRV